MLGMSVTDSDEIANGHGRDGARIKLRPPRNQELEATFDDYALTELEHEMIGFRQAVEFRRRVQSEFSSFPKAAIKC